MLEYFYNTINKNPHSTVYCAALERELDVVEEEPIHVISIPSAPEKCERIPAPENNFRKPPDHLYKSYDFPEVLLFGIMRLLLRYPE